MTNELHNLTELRTVDEVVEYQGGYADYTAILNEANKQEVRVYFLKHLRDEWEWKGDHISEKHDNGHVQFVRKSQ